MWLIWNTSKRLYVKAGTGHDNPFTNRRDLAEQYSSYEAAKAQCCGNEYPVAI